LHEAVGVVEEAVADGAGHHGIADVVVPLGGWHLAGEDSGAISAAVLEDLEEIAPLLVLGRGESPVVDLCGAPHKSIHVDNLIM
jgi:hypothetical protein